MTGKTNDGNMKRVQNYGVNQSRVIWWSRLLKCLFFTF